MDTSTDFGRLVWISDPNEGFVAARITDISKDGFTLVTEKTNQTVTRRYDETFGCEEDSQKSVEDNCALMHLNEATLLNNCRVRYANRKIYSYVANILISINPYQPIDGLYSSKTISDYCGKSLNQKEPHIFAIADRAYREMRRTKTSQSIIVSGESGAGKTESQKAILKYLCENWGADSGPIQKKLLETNPILEAFGNAKTLRNNNSSRFGKFVEIHFDNNGKVAGGHISHYLLETSRICRQASGERNYHIFYQLIAGSSDELYKKLRLAPSNSFQYLKHGAPIFFTKSDTKKDRIYESNFVADPMVDDFRDFSRLSEALTSSGINSEEQMFIWSTIAGILHLGNVQFEENVNDSRGGCMISDGSGVSLENAAQLLGLEPEEMKLGLCARIMQATKGGVKGTLIRVPLKAHESSAGRDALAKAIYSRLFDWLVTRVNKSIPFEKSSSYIGVLDVAGFEFFAVNSFEQFCINYCNEKLQQFFNERILKQEQELYAAEGLNVRRVEFTDNQDCIDLFEGKGAGLFDLLDEEAKLPRATFQHFTQRAHETHRKHFRLDAPRKSKVKSHREMRDDEGLLIRHYAGSVCYKTRYFVEKNNDQLHNSLEFLIEQSKFPLIVSLFGSSGEKPKSAGGGKLKAVSVGAKFKSQLLVLIEKLKSTGNHFVRCIKPNNQMEAWKFDGSAILGQLQCAGMASVLRLMHAGFPSRTSFSSLYEMYKKNLPMKLANLDPRLFSKCLFFAFGLDHDEFQFGLTKVFFRAGKFAEFDQMMRQDPETLGEIIEKVNGWLVKLRWRKAQFGAWSVVKLKNKISYRSKNLIKIQAWLRGCHVRRSIQTRLSIYRKVCALLEHSREMTDVGFPFPAQDKAAYLQILARMNESSQDKWRQAADGTSGELELLVLRIKNADVEAEVDRAVECYEECVKRVDAIIAELKLQLENDELAEVERQRKEFEEKERKEIEEKKAAEQEQILRRKMESEREKAQKEYESQLEAHAQKETAKRAEERLARDREERERLDVLVSARLASTDGVALVAGETSTSSGSSSTTHASSSSNKQSKFDLGSWKYADLRDAINTSNDAGNQSGMWYAHFNGQYIQRQLTLRPSQKPQLLHAGRDDLQMCELPLEQTGLLRKKGAEISANDFDTMWQHYGGQPVNKWTP